MTASWIVPACGTTAFNIARVQDFWRSIDDAGAAMPRAMRVHGASLDKILSCRVPEQSAPPYGGNLSAVDIDLHWVQRVGVRRRCAILRCRARAVNVNGGIARPRVLAWLVR